MDQRLNIQKVAKELGVGMQILTRKKKFPFPIKLHGENFTSKNLADNIRELILESTHGLIGGGKEFSLIVSKTESLEIKHSVKNVIQCLLKFVCIIIYGCSIKHNNILEVSLQTSKSIAIPIYEVEQQNEN